MDKLWVPRITLGVSRVKIGEILHSARVMLGFSLRELAERCRVSAPQLHRMERGHGEYSIERLARVCTVLGLPVAGVLDWSLRIGAPTPPVPFELLSKIDETIALAENLGLSQQAVLKAIQIVFSQVQNYLLLALVRSDSPTTMAVKAGLGAAFEETLQKVVDQVVRQGNTERAAALHRLAQEPYSQLAEWGFFEPDVLKIIVKDEKPIRMPEWSVPKWLASALAGESSARRQPRSRAARPPTKSLTVFGLYPDNSKKNLHIVPACGNTGGVQTEIAKLRARLRRATQSKGMKTSLAKYLGVKLPRISEWLSSREPSGDTTLHLLRWVEQSEMQQQEGSGAADTVPEPTTRTKKGHHEKHNRLKSGRKKP